MSTVAALPSPALSAPRYAARPWLIAAAVVIPTFMEVLDTTIANVALRYIAGGLSAAATDSEWVITSYLAANAIILPLSGYLAAHLGRRNYFLMSIAMFTLSSALCGMATSLTALVVFRVMQGLAGGGLQPSSQAILLDAFPPEKQGAAQTLFGIAALIAPVVGPTLGGWITDNYEWRWIFYLNIPVGIGALVICHALVVDPDYLKAERKRLRSVPSHFDTLGLILLATTMVCWEVILSKGQEWDWFGDPFFRVQVLTLIFGGSLIGLVVRELRYHAPIINLRVLKDRNFRACCIIIFCAFGVLYANTTQLPGMLQTLFGYDATTSGLVLSPAGIFAILTLIVVGALLGRQVDARWLIAAGLVVLGLGNFWLSRMNLEITPWQVVWPRVVIIAGLSMIFAPLNVAAFLYMPPRLRGAAVGLLALLRNEGGSVGTSVAQTVLERRTQFHTLRLNELLDPFNSTVNAYLAQGREFLLRQTGDAVMSGQAATQILADLREQQALLLSYFDVFFLCGAIAVVLAFLVLLMRRSVAEKGAHIAAE